MNLIYRLMGEFLLPPFSLALLALAGLLLLGRRPILGRLAIGLSVVLLFVLAMPVWSVVFKDESGRLVYTPPPWPPADAIVILGGGRRQFAVEYGAPETAGEGTLDRLRYGAKLARETKLPILVSGGRPHLGASRGWLSEGEIMRDILEREYGLPVRWTEKQADDTLDNARLSAPILKGAGVKRIYLVTHAWHAERAAQAFEAEGIEVFATPTYFEPEARINADHFLPSYWGLDLTRRLIFDRLNRLLIVFR